MKAPRYLMWLAACVLTPLLIIYIPKGFMNFFFGGQRWSQDYNLFIDRNMALAYPLFWITVGFWAVVAACLSWYARYGNHYDETADRPDYYGDLKRGKRRQWRHEHREVSENWKDNARTEGYVFGTIALALIVFASVQGFTAWWDNQDYPNHYNEATTFVVPGLDPEEHESVRQLLSGARQGDGEECDLVGDHDVPSCIVEGEFPDDGFENRGASLATATRILTRTSGEAQRVDLLGETVAYLYPDEPPQADEEGTANGYWSGIRDGSKYTPTEGVALWDGVTREAEVCEFDGRYELDRALRGERRNSMTHLIADEYPGLRWNRSDAYGYCEADRPGQPIAEQEPVLILPMFRNVETANRANEVPAGALEVRGSSDGEPQFNLIRDVSAGSIPGPVYPLSIAEDQRETHVWAAGRGHKNKGKFGFETTNAATQTDNASEFQLRWIYDGRSYWVTPMVPNSSGQRVRAYSLIASDEVHDGQLNEMTIYVLADDDPRSVDIETLATDIETFASEDSQAFAKNGVVQEVIPSVGSSWIAFGAAGDGSNKQPYFVAEYDPTTASPRPVFTYLRGALTDEPEGEESVACDKPLSDQSDSELIACGQAVFDEIERRGSD